MSNTQTDAPTHVRHGVVGLILSLIAVAYLDRVCISIAAPAMRADLGLSDVFNGPINNINVRTRTISAVAEIRF